MRQRPEPPQTLPDVLLYTMTVGMRTQAVLEAPLAAADAAVVYVPGPEWRPVSPLDFTHTEALMANAYESARTFLATLDVDGTGLYGRPGG